MADADARARPETIWLNARLATLAADRPGLGAIERGAIAARDGRIVFAGPRPICRPIGATARGTIDCDGRWITPGLIDCHTHLVYAGDRAARIRAAARRRELRGDRAGGRRHRRHGRARRARRARTNSSPVAAAARRADRRGRHDGRDQIRLRARSREPSARCCAPRARSATSAPVAVAHHLPRRARAAAGIRRRPRRLYRPRRATRCCRRSPPKGWPTPSTAFARRIAFSPRRDRARVRRGASARPAGQAARRSAVQPAAARRWRPRFGALSADHLEYTRRGRRRRRWRGPERVAVLLPGAFYTLRETQAPPVELLREHRRADGGGDRLQSRHVAADLAAAGDEHGGDAVPADGRRMSRRRDPRRRARARARRRGRHARSRASAAIWRSGTSSARPNSSIASASIRCIARVWRGR